MGNYPSNLESVRIPHFQNKIKENQTFIFLYANYDNPISGADQNYCVIGVGLLKEKSLPKRFEGQDEIFEEKRKETYKRNQNFPRINWALRYSLDFPRNIIRLPYHEYLKKS